MYIRPIGINDVLVTDKKFDVANLSQLYHLFQLCTGFFAIFYHNFLLTVPITHENIGMGLPYGGNFIIITSAVFD